MNRLYIGILSTIAITAAACFSPEFRSEIACDEGRCPSGYTCDSDAVCRQSGGDFADAGIPSVQCETSKDCENPTDSCLLPGPCGSDGFCEFGQVDCSALDGDCTAGVCRSGDCQEINVREDDPCGEATTCSEFSTCAVSEEMEACTQVGSQTRSCVGSACQSGECVAVEPFNDMEECAVQTDGDSCGSSTVTDCGSCNYSDMCDESAVKTCTCTDFECDDGGCVEIAASCQQACNRDTDEDPCLLLEATGALGGSCCLNGICREFCP